MPSEPHPKKGSRTAEKRAVRRPIALESYFNTSREAAFILRLNGAVTYVNQRALDIVGYTSQDVLDKNFIKLPLFTPKSRLQAMGLFARCLAGESIGPETMEVARKDGSPAWVVLYGNRVPGPGSELVTVVVNDITPHKMATDEIKQEWDRVKRYLDAANIMLLALDTNGMVTMVNQKGCDVLGLPEEEILDKNWFQTFLPKRRREKVRRVFRKFMNGENTTEIHAYENTVITSSGEEKLISWRNSVVRDEDGTAVGIMSSGEDITERREIANALREIQEFNSILLDASPSQIVVFNPDMSIKYVNPSWVKLNGWTSEEVVGMKPPFPWWPKGETEEWTAAFTETFGTGPGNGEAISLKKNGETYWMTMNWTPVKTNGTLTYWLVNAVDITERKLAEDALLESEDRYRTLVSSSNDGIISVNGRMEITLWNHGAETIFGYKERDQLGNCILGIVPAYAHEAMRAAFDSFTATGKIPANRSVIEVTGIRKDGSQIPLELSLSSAVRNGEPVATAFMRDITKRKEAEKALHESEERFAKGFNASPAGVSITTMDNGTFIEVNNSFTELLAYTREEAIGHASLELDVWVNPADRDRMIRLLQEQGRVRNEEFEFRSKTGEIRTYLFSAEPLTVNGRECLISSWFDITERKEAEQALHESEERFAKAFNASPDATVITSVADGTYIEVNHGFTELLEYTREEAVGRTSRELGIWANPADRDRMVRLMEKRGRLRNEEFEFRAKSGQIRTFETWAEYVTVAGEQCLISSSVDVTERKQAENLLKTLADSSPIGVYIAQEGIFKHVNRHLVEILNQPLDKLIGMPTSTFIQPKDRTMTRKNAIAMLKGQRSHPYAYRVVDETGTTRYVMETVASIMYRGKRAVLGNLMDVTQMEAMENELRKHRDHLEDLVNQRTTELTTVNHRLEEELVQRQQMEAALVRAKEAAEVANQTKSEFLAHMSHEIRTPIHGMIGMINLALDCSQDMERRQYLGMALSSADALQSVINDILDISKIEAGQLDMLHEDFDLLTVVEDATEALAAVAFKKGLEITAQVAPDVPTALNGDPGHLRQVITNLLGNAIKFTVRGEVALRVEKVSTHKKTAEVVFSVRDTGIGIPQDKLDIIFDPFSQADGSINREYGGTGLGLAISRHLVNNMQGRLWVKSAPEHGSTFYFTAKFDKSAQKTVPAAPLPAFRGKAALVVEDNATGRGILKYLLGQLGFAVTAAESGLEAEKHLQENPERYNLILVDRTLPDEEGLDVAVRLRNLAPQADTIMMLPPDNISAEYYRCQEAGITNHIVKPVRASRLLGAIQSASGRAHGRREPVAPAPLTSHGPHLRILVAEDNATSQLVARKMLEKMGHTVAVADNGLTAIRLVEAETFDLILMDAEMPIMNGMEATRRIRKSEAGSGRHIPIIAMTAYAMKADRDRCLQAGMDGYLSKPAKPNEINALVRSFSPSEADPGAAAIDMDDAMRTFGEDIELLHEAADIFMEQDYPEQMAAIKDGITRQDAEAVRMAAHSIKGAARSLGGRRLGTIALKLEEAGRSGNLSQAETLVTELDREAARLADFFTTGATT